MNASTQASENTGKMVTPASSSNSINDPRGENADVADNSPAQADESKDDGDEQSPHHPIAEFLYQLTKMLQDDNDEVIEWTQGRIRVHFPDRLESEVLHKYFRHSKFASFQRQLNYFGFRKIAGKGKMAPCSYVNEACTGDIKSLLHIKRKTNGSAARKAAMNRAMQAERMHAAGNFNLFGGLPPHLSQALMSSFAGGFPGAANPLLSPQLQQTPALFGANDQQAALAAFAAGQNRQSASDFARFAMAANPAMGALEQMANQQAAQQTALAQLAAAVGNNGLSGYVAAQTNMQGSNSGTTQGPASTMPATAAMNAAAAASGKGSNLFENTPNLQSFVNEQQQQQQKQQAGQQAANRTVNGGSLSNRVASQNLLNRLPSSGTLFPDAGANNLSSASLSQLFNQGAVNPMSNNRLASMVSLNNYLSREPSLVDLLLAAPNNGQFPVGFQGIPQPPNGGMPAPAPGPM